MHSRGAAQSAAQASVAGGNHRRELLSLTPYERHRRLLEDYAKYYNRTLPTAQPAVKTDKDVLQETFRFIRTEEDDRDGTWEQRLARRYYDKLFKEYCLADLSRYKTQQIGLRWRTEREVVLGKGQFSCGNKRCDARDGLCSYEVNFSYVESGEEKSALVKLRVCPKCAYLLNYGRTHALQRADRKREAKEAAAAHRRKRRSAGLRDEDGGGGAKRRRRRRDGEGAAEGSDDGDGSQEAEEEEDEEEEGGEGGGGGGDAVDESAFWRGEKKEEKEPTAEEQMDEYFQGLFA